MTAKIVTISREDPWTFIRRNGPTLTHEIAQRFAVEQKQVLEVLKGMEALGLVAKRRVGIDNRGGAGWEWTAKP